MAWIARTLLVLALAALPAGEGLAAAAQRTVLESDVKATYIFQFGRFVRWPPGAVADGRPFTVCVIGRDPFGSKLDTTLANETIGGRQAVAKRTVKPDELSDCQIVFVPSSEEGRLEAILKALAGRPVLTVSDMPRFIEHGGMIQFVTVDQRVRFDINLTATDAAGLTPGSELARVALTIRRQTPTGR